MRAYSAENFYDSSFIEVLERSGAFDPLYR
jgi:hypothetical protein